MFDLGMQELVVIFVVALVVFGPKRLPELGRAIGKTMGQLRSAISDVRSEVEKEIRVAETGLDLEEMPAWKKRGAETEPAPPEKEPEGEKPQDEKPEEEEPADETERKGEDN